MTINLLGKIFGRVTVIGYTEERSQNSIVWLCKCKCGRTAKIASRDLIHTARRGCGNCADTNHPLYSIWTGIISRCMHSNNEGYKNYGGRGITVCPRWKDDFLNFVEDMGPRPSTYHSTERRNNNGNYEPGNCYWGTAIEQAANKRPPIQTLTKEEIISIYDSKEDAKVLSIKYGLAVKSIRNIKCGSNFFNITSDHVLSKLKNKI